MPNSFDTNPRSPSDRRLAVVGACFMVVAVVIAGSMIAKSKGKFDHLVPVNIELVNIGDGLPARSDVKFRGVLVGAVADVTPSRHGQPNVVHVDLKPQYAAWIPNTVTARVIPTNAFAVSGVQLVDNGPGSAALRAGSLVREDTTLPTVLFQNVLAKLRELLAAVGRKPETDSVGVLATLGEATRGRRAQLVSAGHDVTEALAQLNTVVNADDSGTSTLSALTAAADSLREGSPELFDALGAAIRPMQTFTAKRRQLTDFLSGGLSTAATLGDGFDHQTDRMIVIGTELTPVLGVLADHADEFHGISTRMQVLANKAYREGWDRQTNKFIGKGIIAFTPTRSYVRADCPRYGALEGPSCQTAPETPTAPDLMPALGSMGATVPGYVTENRPNLTPPRSSMPGDPQGPPAPPPPPGVTPPLRPGAAQLPGSPPAPPAETHPQSAELPRIGGNVGPVGSRQEADRLGRIVGDPVGPATQLLLGPVARGMTVHIAADGAR
ncbi:MAG TPA: MCE family protein [Mycobacterium sp.]|nr:MCE family protein [Mycobacterium sp.]